MTLGFSYLNDTPKLVHRLTENFRKKEQRFIGFTAQIIQHEVDHCNGILI